MYHFVEIPRCELRDIRSNEMVFRVRTVKIERNIVTTARECNRRRIDPIICDDDRRETNRAPQVKRPSIARRALFNFRASRRVAARCMQLQF